VLKDHASAGVTLALKNMSHGFVNNVARSHGNPATNACNTFIPAIVSHPTIRAKVVLHILDGIRGMFDGGPSGYMGSTWEHHTLYFATDPVAMDRVGWDEIDARRILRGLPPVAESRWMPAQNDDDHRRHSFRQPEHIELSAALGLGVFERERIDLRRWKSARRRTPPLRARPAAGQFDIRRCRREAGASTCRGAQTLRRKLGKDSIGPDLRFGMPFAPSEGNWHSAACCVRAPEMPGDPPAGCLRNRETRKDSSVRKSLLFPGILVALAFVSASAERAAGATGPIDYSNKTWNLDGSVKSRAKGSGSQTTKGELSVAFDDANFILTDAQGDVLQGSYLSDAKGKAVLTPDNESLQAYVATKVEKGFASAASRRRWGKSRSRT
jgi:hypothetical protein